MNNQNCPDFQIYKKLKIDSSISVNDGTPNELLTLSNLEDYVNSNLTIQSNQVIQNSKINQKNEKVIFPVTCTVENIPDYTSITVQPNNQIINGFDLTNQQVGGNLTINGVQLKSGDYVFVNKQTSTQRNGIYQTDRTPLYVVDQQIHKLLFHQEQLYWVPILQHLHQIIKGSFQTEMVVILIQMDNTQIVQDCIQ